MSETHESTQAHDGARRYEIRIKGHLDTRWADRFAGLSFTHESDGTTLLSGVVVDQAALHGLLRNVRDLGLPLLSVAQVEPRRADGSDGSAHADDNRTNKETDR
jgi:hypothetical protein